MQKQIVLTEEEYEDLIKCKELLNQNREQYLEDFFKGQGDTLLKINTVSFGNTTNNAYLVVDSKDPRFEKAIFNNPKTEIFN